MHRSGTSMVTRLLESLGLFVGKKRNSNDEAVFFHDINTWLIEQSGGSWDNPTPVLHLLENQKIREQNVHYVADYLMASSRSASFLGWQKYFKYRDPANLDVPWGWKSPLNTYTLPLWLDIFPQAKVLHIYRHGVDVAQSLRYRGRRDMKRSGMQELYYKLKFVHSFMPKTGKFIDSVRCDSLEGGLSLWEEYLTEARGHVRNLGARALELRYEDFLSDPGPALREIVTFCGLPADEASIAAAAKQIKNDRAFAYRSNAELKEFAEKVAPRLVLQNYP